MLETILDIKHGIKIPHNIIHKILKDYGLASNDSNKQRRRKWIKYERKHSMSLWHTDWYMIKDDKRYSGKWLIAYLDDGSRFITGYNIFDEATIQRMQYLYWKEVSTNMASHLNYLQTMVVSSM